MFAKMEVAHGELSKSAKRRWFVPSLMVLKDASKSEVCTIGPADDGGFVQNS